MNFARSFYSGMSDEKLYEKARSRVDALDELVESGLKLASWSTREIVIVF